MQAIKCGDAWQMKEGGKDVCLALDDTARDAVFSAAGLSPDGLCFDENGAPIDTAPAPATKKRK